LIDLAPATVLLPTRKKGCVVPEFNGKPPAPPINVPCAWNSFSVDLVAGGGAAGRPLRIGNPDSHNLGRMVHLTAFSFNVLGPFPSTK